MDVNKNIFNDLLGEMERRLKEKDERLKEAESIVLEIKESHDEIVTIMLNQHSETKQRLEKAEAVLNEINGMSFSISNLYEAGQTIHRVTFLVEEYFDFKARGEE